MNNTISNISKHLINEFNGIEITVNEFINLANCTLTDISDNIVKVYKVEDENIIENLLSEIEKEEILITVDHLSKNHLLEDGSTCSSYMNKISTGKLIVVTLESNDGVHLSGFTMDGSGEKLYNYLLSFIDGKVEKNDNPLDETISELAHFRPYGKYFK